MYRTANPNPAGPAAGLFRMLRPKAFLVLAALACLIAPCLPGAISFNALPKTEPTVRIGIVLPVDHKLHLNFVLPAGREYRLSSGSADETFTIDRPTSGTAAILGSLVQVTIQTTPKSRVVAGTHVTIAPTRPQKLEKGSGILVKALVAGRGFHWQKHIDQTLLGSIQFYPWEDGHLVVVNELPIEHYLAGVITAEMSGKCPIEFMKAQTIAARSWFFAQGKITKHAPLPFSMCNDDDCQRYQGTGDLSPRAIRAIEETRGEVIVTADQNVCNANYSKSCGGIMADPVAIWGHPSAGQYSAPDAPKGSTAAKFFPVTNKNAREYLTGNWLKTTDIFCSPNVVPENELPEYLGRVDVAEHYFRWTVTYTRAELERILRKKVPLPDLGTLTGIIPGTRESSGRLMDLTLTYLDSSGKPARKQINGQFNIRNCFHPSFLYSSAFVIDTTKGKDGYPDKYILHGGGWGHGAGLCQIGALGMALKGYHYPQILLHYFRNTTLKRAYH